MGFAGPPSVRPVHCLGERYRSRMKEVEVEQLRIADAYSCEVKIEPPRTKHPEAGLNLFAVKTFSKGDITGPCYGNIVYHDLSSP